MLNGVMTRLSFHCSHFTFPLNLHNVGHNQDAFIGMFAERLRPMLAP